jgi:hypothetical protein
MEGALQVIRALAFLVLLALAFAACDRFVNLSPPPDAHVDDSPGVPPDAATIHDVPPDAFLPD